MLLLDEVFNIASGVETSLRGVLDLLLQVTGHVGLAPELLPERKVNPVPRRLADVDKARRLLGFTCSVGLEEGLRRLVEWRRETVRRQQRENYDPHNETLVRS